MELRIRTSATFGSSQIKAILLLENIVCRPVFWLLQMRCLHEGFSCMILTCLDRAPHVLIHSGTKRSPFIISRCVSLWQCIWALRMTLFLWSLEVSFLTQNCYVLTKYLFFFLTTTFGCFRCLQLLQTDLCHSHIFEASHEKLVLSWLEEEPENHKDHVICCANFFFNNLFLFRRQVVSYQS